MARIGEEASFEALEKEACHPMDFTGRPMKGYVFVTPDGFDTDQDLTYWLQLCLDFNPFAQASKKTKEKKMIVQYADSQYIELSIYPCLQFFY